ncbi:MAG: hypothetical protein ABS76_35650 [Pelagibacterium sp. SCN 64-44]|nr:MAG: hypothetical protein ABS76_35650 [Pelagibacterium sp. SCN 64-44]
MLFIEAARARAAIAQTYNSIELAPTAEAWRSIKMGIKRDLQARRLRPNVPVPSRRRPLEFLRVMHRETGSLPQAVMSLFHDGSWTSSGGSFRLAEEVGVDITELCDRALERKGSLRVLEIGAGWAGLRSPTEGQPRNIAGLAKRYERELGRSVHIHMTNLTPWHGSTLPDGLVEHPYVTAGALAALESQGLHGKSCDLIYSQAAAYFEVDYTAFLAAAAHLLGPGGVLIFNHRTELAGEIDVVMKRVGLKRQTRIHLGGMNGSVVHFERPPASRKKTLAAFEPPARSDVK